jgi:hypothetical protein
MIGLRCFVLPSWLAIPAASSRCDAATTQYLLIDSGNGEVCVRPIIGHRHGQVRVELKNRKFAAQAHSELRRSSSTVASRGSFKVASHKVRSDKHHGIPFAA